MPEGSRKPTFSQYNVKPVCAGCGRKLKAKDEVCMWFRGGKTPAVFGYCCWTEAATA